MGKLLFADWGRLMMITAGVYVFWAGGWGIFYRKFMFDMVGGVLGPEGLIPPPSAAPFVNLTVNIPLFQILNIFNGLMTLAMVYPLPIFPFKSSGKAEDGAMPTLVERSIWLRIFWCLWASFPACIQYQSLDASLFFLVAAGVHVAAANRGETLVKPPSRGGRGGAATPDMKV